MISQLLTASQKRATLEEILDNKERRSARQKELLRSHKNASLLSLSLNMAGNLKLSYEAKALFEVSKNAIKALNIGLLHKEEYIAITGAELLCVCDIDAKKLKSIVCELENTHPLGRLMDIDVLDSDGKIISRSELSLPKRRCFVCQNEAHICARSRAHSYEELYLFVQKMVRLHAPAQILGVLVREAMLKEVELTPKAGLVDKQNSGSHRDMDIRTFYKSIDAITPFVEKFFNTPKDKTSPSAIFMALREIGIECEKAMFEATKGINTHKGMIFILALICGAYGTLYHQKKQITKESLSQTIKELSNGLVNEDLQKQKPSSNGARFFYETNSRGIRGEAEDGFEMVFFGSEPFFKENLYRGEEIALKRTLLWLISRADDSTLWARGGVDALKYAKAKASELLGVEDENLDDALNIWDLEMQEKNLSTGGSADLLSFTWLVAYLVL